MRLERREPDVEADGESQDGAEHDEVGKGAQVEGFLRDDGGDGDEEGEEDEDGVGDGG